MQQQLLRQPWSRHQACRVSYHLPFPNGKFEEGTNRSQLACDRRLFQIKVVQMRHEFANHQVRDVCNRGRLDSGRGQEGSKLNEIRLVASERVWRGIAHRAQIVQELAHRGFHVPPLR